MTETATRGANQPWHEEFVDQVRKHAENGLSSRQIAAELQVTRNVIIGLCSRRGILLKGGAKERPVAKRSAPAKPRAIRVSLPNLKPEPVMVLPPAPPSVTPVSILELNDARCRWPLGDFADRPPYQFCGAKTFAGSWCPYHRHLAGLNKETRHALRSFKAEAA